jgi:hypothetical protein
VKDKMLECALDLVRDLSKYTDSDYKFLGTMPTRVAHTEWVALVDRANAIVSLHDDTT